MRLAFDLQARFGAVANEAKGDQSGAIRDAFEAYREVDPEGRYGCQVLLPPGLLWCETTLGPIPRAVVFKGLGANVSGIGLRDGVDWAEPFLTCDSEAIWFDDLQITQGKTVSSEPIVDIAGVQTKFRNTVIGVSNSTAIRVRKAGTIVFNDLGVGNGGFFLPEQDVYGILVSEESIVRGETLTVVNPVEDPHFIGLGIRSGRNIFVGGRFVSSNAKTALALIPGSGEAVRNVIVSHLAVTGGMSDASIRIAPDGGTADTVQIGGASIRTSRSATGQIEVSGTPDSIRCVALRRIEIGDCTGHGIHYSGGTSCLDIEADLIAGNSGNGIEIVGPQQGFTIRGRITGNAIGVNIPAGANYFIVDGHVSGNKVAQLCDASGGATKRISLADRPMLLGSDSTDAPLTLRGSSPAVDFHDTSEGAVPARWRLNFPYADICYDAGGDGGFTRVSFRARYVVDGVNHLRTSAGMAGGSVIVDADGESADVRVIYDGKGEGGATLGTTHLSFYGAAPVPQPEGFAAPLATDGTATNQETAERLNALAAILQKLGLTS